MSAVILCVPSPQLVEVAAISSEGKSRLRPAPDRALGERRLMPWQNPIARRPGSFALRSASRVHAGAG